MKILASIFLAFVMFTGAYSQDQGTLSKREIKKMQREQRKADQAAELEKQAVITEFMVTNQQFVLEADYLSDKRGTRVPVSSMINFIMIDSATATVQFGSAYTVGYNGVGGATLEGRVSNYKSITTGKQKQAYSVSWNFMSSLGTYDISLLVNPNGYADATIRGNWSGKLNYHGKLVPLQMSRVYKAMPTY